MAQTLFLRRDLTKVRARGGRWFCEFVRKLTKLTGQRREPAQDAPTTFLEGEATRILAENQELVGCPIDPAMAPVAPVGQIAILQVLLTVDPPGSTRPEPGNGRGIAGDVEPGGSGPDVLVGYTPSRLPLVAVPVERAIAIAQPHFRLANLLLLRHRHPESCGLDSLRKELREHLYIKC